MLKQLYKKMGDDDAYQDDCCYNLQQSIDMALKAIAELHGDSMLKTMMSEQI